MTDMKVAPPGLEWTPRPPTLLFVSDEKRRARPAAQYGPTAAAVAANVARLRKARGWSIYALAGALERAEKPITPSGLAKLEKQQRQVTVDDLTALAVVFGVSPSALLLQFTDGPDKPVSVTGAGEVPALAAWEWADGRTPLKYESGRHPEDQWMEYELYGRPAWLRPLRSGGNQYSGDQMEAYREQSKVRGTFRWDAEGNPVWQHPKGDADGPGVD